MNDVGLLRTCRFCAEEIPSRSELCPICEEPWPFGKNKLGKIVPIMGRGLWRARYWIIGLSACVTLIYLVIVLVPLVRTSLNSDPIETAKGLIQEGRYQDAIVQLKEILRSEQSNAPAWKALGVAYSKINNLEGALQSFEKYLVLKPDDQKTAQWVDYYRKRK